MEKANPFGLPVPPNASRDQIAQELNEILEISIMIDSRLENIDHNQIVIPPPALPKQLLIDFLDPPDLLKIDDIVSDAESVDTPRVSPFLDSDDESDEGEVINDIYLNTKYYNYNRQINKFDERELAFPCIIDFRQFVAYFDPNLSMNIITRRALNIIMVQQLASRDDNFVAIVRNVHVFVRSFTYTTNFTVFEDIGEYIESELSEVVMGKPFKELTHLEYDYNKGLFSFNRLWDTYIFQMPRTIPRLKNLGYHQWSKIPPLLVLSDRDRMSELKYPYEKNKLMYKGSLNLGPEYQFDEDMKEWLIRGHVRMHGTN
ncbi:hypothetical protein Tco_1562328 [Tanacetum coccineum]